MRTSSRLARWSLQLSQYNYDIEYRKSINHGNADALSRLPAGVDEQFNQFCEDEEQTERFVAAIELQFIRNGPIYFK